MVWCDNVTTVLLEAQIKMRNGFPQLRLSFYTLYAGRPEPSPDSQPITAGQGIESEKRPAIKIQTFSISTELIVLHFDGCIHYKQIITALTSKLCHTN